MRSELDYDIIKRRAQDLGIRWTLIYPLLLSALFFLSYFFFHLYYILFLFFLLLDVVPKTTTDDKKGVDRSSTVIARDNTEGRLNSHFSFKKHLFWFMYVWLLIIINVWVALFFFRITTYYYVLEKKAVWMWNFQLR